MRVFVSYSHQQGSWVWERLVPVLEAAEVEVLIDKTRFTAGRSAVGQMDALQDGADASLLLLSPEYEASPYCRHERDRAITMDPQFQHGKVIPVQRAACAMTGFPPAPHVPLWVDLRDDAAAAPWQLLLRSVQGSGLRACPTHWLEVKDSLIRKLWHQAQTVNLVIHGKPNWQSLLEHLRTTQSPALGIVNLDNPATITRAGLVGEMLAACGHHAATAKPPGDLTALNALLQRPRPAFLALQHFEHVAKRTKAYGEELFNTLRYQMEQRKLVLLIESRVPFRDLLPANHLLSHIQTHDLVLRGNP